VFANINEIAEIESSKAWNEQEVPKTIYELIQRTKNKYPQNNAVSFQLLSDPSSFSETLKWDQLYQRVCQTANFFNSLGLGRDDTVAFLLPNCLETIYTLIGGMVACKVNPINPLLSAPQIAGILRSSNAKALVTLESFPKANIAQLTAEALKEAPKIEHVIEVSLARYLKPPKSWLIPFVRPKPPHYRNVKIHKFYKAIDSQRGDSINFEDCLLIT